MCALAHGMACASQISCISVLHTFVTFASVYGLAASQIVWTLLRHTGIDQILLRPDDFPCTPDDTHWGKAIEMIALTLRQLLGVMQHTPISVCLPGFNCYHDGFDDEQPVPFSLLSPLLPALQLRLVELEGHFKNEVRLPSDMTNCCMLAVILATNAISAHWRFVFRSSRGPHCQKLVLTCVYLCCSCCCSCCTANSPSFAALNEHCNQLQQLNALVEHSCHDSQYSFMHGRR